MILQILHPAQEVPGLHTAVRFPIFPLLPIVFPYMSAAIELKIKD